MAIAVYPGGGHVGLLHREQDGRPLFITHMCFYDGLYHTEASPDCCILWIAIDVDDDEASIVTAACRRAIKKIGRNEFPYAFSSPKGFFDQYMRFEQGPGKIGLTCATFVLAVFNAVGMDLVRYDSWPIRDEDPAVREYLMFITKVPPHIRDRIRNETMVSPLYRPLEVAGAAARTCYPIGYKKAVRYSRRLLLLIRQMPP